MSLCLVSSLTLNLKFIFWVNFPLFYDYDHVFTGFSKIQKGSGCVLQSEVLTCVCISEGFPLPTIKWPLLKNHTEYSVITMVSKHTVNSTVSVTVNKHSNSTVECVSNNGNGENRENLLIHQNLPEKHGMCFPSKHLSLPRSLFTYHIFLMQPC